MRVFILFLFCMGYTQALDQSHLLLISTEIDSSEYGGPPGDKGTTCPCGWTNKNNGRIVGGKETEINEYPFIAHLHFGNIVCCGSIITSRHILTAAHCTWLKKPGQIRVKVAEHDNRNDWDTNETKTYGVEEIINHESYNGSTFKNDISILYLTTDIEFNKFIGPVCLPKDDLSIENKYVKAIGWGREENSNNIVSPVLRDVFLRILTPQMCAQAWGSLFSAENPTQYCTWGKGKSACSGDSGGPNVWLDPETNRYTLAGIISFGKKDSTGDCGNSIPRVSTKVSAYLGWINDVIARSRSICTKQ